MKVRKRTRTNLDEQNCDPYGPPVNRHEDQPIGIEERQILHRHKHGEIPTSSRSQRIGTHCGVQTPSGKMSGMGGVIGNHLRNTISVSGNAALASRLSTIPRDEERINITSRVPVTAVQGKRFILFDDDDDDDDDEL